MVEGQSAKQRSLSDVEYDVINAIGMEAEGEIDTKAVDDVLRANFPCFKWPAALAALYRKERERRLYREAGFLLLLGMAIAVASSLIDFVSDPSLVKEGALLRFAAIGPITALAFLARAKGWSTVLCVSVALLPIFFALVVIYLAMQLPPTYAERYLTGTAILLGVANLVQPFRMRALIMFDIAFIALASITMRMLSGVDTTMYLDYEIILLIVACSTLFVAYRFNRLQEATFLQTLLARLTAHELMEANKNLFKLSERDPLTGLANRRYFERVYEEASNARLAGSPDVPSGNFGIFMIDLDHFKPFNDRHGHQAGDSCLVKVADAIRACFSGKFAMVARFGGEEFVAGIVETRPGELYEIAENVRHSIEQLGANNDGTPLITASVGLATMPPDIPTPLPTILEAADAALYSAKSNGRNRVETVEATGLPSRSRTAAVSALMAKEKGQAHA